MPYCNLSGTMLIDLANVFVELSPVQKEGMEELTKEGMNNWEARRLKRQAQSCGGRVFYKIHPELLPFLSSFPFRRRYTEAETYVSLYAMHNDCALAELVLEQVVRKSQVKVDVGYIGRGSISADVGWVMIGSTPPNSELMPCILADRLGTYGTRVMGLPDRRMWEITKAILDEHYIHFDMRDRTGKYNSLTALIPTIGLILQRSSYPTPEIAELCRGEPD